MTTTQVIGPYECHNAYRELHTGPVGREWMAFVAECNQRLQEGDGAAPAALPPAVAAIATQPAPSPFTVDGGAR